MNEKYHLACSVCQEPRTSTNLKTAAARRRRGRHDDEEEDVEQEWEEPGKPRPANKDYDDGDREAETREGARVSGRGGRWDDTISLEKEGSSASPRYR